MEERTEWDVFGESWWARFFAPPLAAAPVVVYEGVRHRLGSSVPFGLVALVTMLVMATAWFVTARTSVRLTPDGVQVCRFFTATYRWSEIARVEPSAEWQGAGRIRLQLRGHGPTAQTETLPFPTASRRPAGDTTVTDARRMIEHRLAATDRPG